MILFSLPLLIALTTVGLVLAGSCSIAIAWPNGICNWPIKKSMPGKNSGRRKTTGRPCVHQTCGKIPASAELLFRRVQQLQQNDVRSVFFVALCYLKRGAANQAMAMLNRIAPADRVGYRAAHAFLAEQMMMRPLNQAEIPLLRHHAVAALDSDQASPQCYR